MNMAENGYGAGPVAGHVGRIPNFGKTQVNPMGSVEPPPCIQNAMMTKDKKPFTYTPGGLDLSQIRTPSMARKMARQRSWEENEQPYVQQQQANGGGNYQPQGGPAPPPPPPQAPAPPPPPPLVIEVPKSKSPNPKPIVTGERPEIVIPDEPIKMLRKTNSPYHWEAEKAELARMGPVPKFVEKAPSPLTVQMPPSTFSQQPPQNYIPQQNNFQQNYPYGHQNNRAPESPLRRPEAQYAKAASPNVQSVTPTREILQRQDSQFNKSPQPFGGQSPLSNGSPYSPSPNNNWKQPERRDSPANNMNNSPQTPPFNRGPFTSNSQQPNYQNQSPQINSGFYTLPRVSQKNQESYGNPPQHTNVKYNNNQQTRPQSPKIDSSNPTPWRTTTLNRCPKENQQTIYHNQNTNQQQAYSPAWKQDNQTRVQPNQQQQYNQGHQQQQYNPPWVREQETNNNKAQDSYRPSWSQERTAPAPPPSQQEQPRYQSTMSIPVTARKQNPQPDYNNTQPQKEAVYVNQEPIYYCPDSPKSIPPWVKTQKEKTKTPPPVWVQRPLEGRKSAPRELVTPPRETEPEWIRKSNEIQRNVREVVSPPKYQQPVQPTWSTRPSENRKSLPRDNNPNTQGNRVIPVQIEASNDRDRQGNQQSQFRVTIDMHAPNVQGQQRIQAPYSQPTQRIMRVLSPQLVRLDDPLIETDLPSVNRNFQNNQDNQPKTRIIPIQIEGGNGGANKSFGGRY